VYRSRRRFEEPGLRWAGWSGFPLGQLQQPKQPRILRPQPREFVGHLNWNLTPNITSAHSHHRKVPDTASTPPRDHHLKQQRRRWGSNSLMDELVHPESRSAVQEARNKHALNVRAEYLAEIRRTQIWHLSQPEVTEAPGRLVAARCR